MTNTYAKAGVSITAGDAVVEKIKPLAAQTLKHLRPQHCQAISHIGGFAACTALPTHLKQPVLVTATDGVGSKLELARQHNRLENIGQDLVAMCVNDLLCAGVYPLQFLDYYACGQLAPDTAATIINGIARACDAAECALVGGETAEVPTLYRDQQFDLAGFAVGIGEAADLLPQSIAPQNIVIALPSSGVHSNGFSLVHHLLAQDKNLSQVVINGVPIIEHLLTPTRLYGKIIKQLRAKYPIRGLAHITGGGIRSNIERILPPNTALSLSLPPLPPLFKTLQDIGNISDSEMQQVFNGGVGMAVVVEESQVEEIIAFLKSIGEAAQVIGSIQAKQPKQ